MKDQRRRSRLTIGLLTCLLSCLLPGLTCAQAIDTNRPGFSYATTTVAPGNWQFESGLAWNEPGDDDESWALPSLELRVGLADSLEVYLSNLSWQNASAPGNDVHGWLDPIVGVKLRLDDGDRIWGAALLAQVSVPLGENAFSTDRWDPAVAFAWSLGTAIPLAGSARVTWLDDEVLFDNGLKLPWSLGDRQVIFAEWEANVREDSDDAHWLNAGYQFLIDAERQLDLNAGWGLNDDAGDFRVGAGFSMRF